jgi:putative methyltransferase (TIGR04325 family)
MTPTSILNQWCPPAVAAWIKQRIRPVDRQGDATEARFAGPYPTWREAAAQATGYDADVIFEKAREATLKVRANESLFERDSVILERPEYPYFLISSLLHVAAARNLRLNVLDFGGALGSSYFPCRKLVSAIPNLRWSVVEQAQYVAYGQRDLQTDVLRFYATIDDCVKVERPNVAILSGVLQYLEHPYELIAQVVGTGIDYVIIDRQPLRPPGSQLGEAIVVVTIPPSIYRASYPFWVLNEERFRGAWSEAYELIVESETQAVSTHIGPLPRRQFFYRRRL